MNTAAKPLPKLPKITAKQEGGDDGYCYVVRRDGVETYSGLTRREVPYYKRQVLQMWCEKNGVDYAAALVKSKL